MTRSTFVPAHSPAQLEYRQYLNSWRWRCIRWLRLRIDGNRCRLCPATEGLHVHHSRYDHRGGLWWRELLDCITLCEDCHRVHHDKM